MHAKVRIQFDAFSIRDATDSGALAGGCRDRWSARIAQPLPCSFGPWSVANPGLGFATRA
ncbi:MAG: hypothetical protein EBT08_07560 [Betaproteobacteria bacterium]|nr:hypothetical protein [Betaproteobacteria bacterium]